MDNYKYRLQCKNYHYSEPPQKYLMLFFHSVDVLHVFGSVNLPVQLSLSGVQPGAELLQFHLKLCQFFSRCSQVL